MQANSGNLAQHFEFVVTLQSIEVSHVSATDLNGGKLVVQMKRGSDTSVNAAYKAPRSNRSAQ